MLAKVDPKTVRAFQLRCPRLSVQDTHDLRNKLDTGEILESFNTLERTLIWNNLVQMDCIIPSLYTFFEDMKYLQSCADSIRAIMGFRHDNLTLSASLEACFDEPSSNQGYCEVEVGDGNFAVRSCSSSQRLKLSKQQLWLCVMRDYPHMSPPVKERKGLLTKARPEKADEDALLGFLTLAIRLGFKTPGLDQNSLASTNAEIIRSALVKGLRPDVNDCWHSINSIMEHVEGIIASQTRHHKQSGLKPMSVKAKRLKSRCGYPELHHHAVDKALLFLDNVHEDVPLQMVTQGGDITSFFVRKCVYMAFMGKTLRQKDTPEELENQQDMSDLDSIVLSESVLDLIRAQSPADPGILAPVVLGSSPTTPRGMGIPLQSQIGTPAEDDAEDRPRHRNIGTQSIRFISYEEGRWKTVMEIPDQNETRTEIEVRGEIEAAVRGLMSSNVQAFSLLLRPILPHECYDEAMRSRKKAVILMELDKISINDELRYAVDKLL